MSTARSCPAGALAQSSGFAVLGLAMSEAILRAGLGVGDVRVLTYGKHTNVRLDKHWRTLC